jgi:hypothetical protein
MPGLNWPHAPHLLSAGTMPRSAIDGTCEPRFGSVVLHRCALLQKERKTLPCGVSFCVRAFCVRACVLRACVRVGLPVGHRGGAACVPDLFFGSFAPSVPLPKTVPSSTCRGTTCYGACSRHINGTMSYGAAYRSSVRQRRLYGIMPFCVAVPCSAQGHYSVGRPARLPASVSAEGAAAPF